MKNTMAFMSFALLALFLTLAPAALATNTWYVDGVNGSDSNDCLSSPTACKTIGHAISLCSSGDTIMIAAATYVENLTIRRSLKIIGSGAATTIVDGNQAGTVVTISSAKARVYLGKLTIRNGLSGAGGGIYNSGTLTINNCTISGNSNTTQLTGGGGIYSEGTSLTINNSTIRENFATNCGGGIYQYASSCTATINNSTISENSAGWCGGGFVLLGSSPSCTATINNSTISGNSRAGYGGGGISTVTGTLTVNNSTISGNSGDGIWASGPVTLQNTIVANSSGGTNCAQNSGTIISNGYSLSSDGSCNFTGTGDMNNTDPMLGTLGNYGGPTQTVGLRNGSPAIDAGNPNGCTDDKGNLLKTDQRGAPRPGKNDISGRCDIGAFERQSD